MRDLVLFVSKELINTLENPSVLQRETINISFIVLVISRLP